jgi:predicted DsbA family dithiol-disulfide isomerase
MRPHSGSAYAALAADYQDADRMGIEGSPSFVLNERRQKLYGEKSKEGGIVRSTDPE